MPLKEQDHILIEKKILGQLTEVEQKVFDDRLNDPDFKKELDLQSDLNIAFRAEGRAHLKNQLNEFEKTLAKKPPAIKENAKRFSIGRIAMVAASLTLLLLIGFWFSNLGNSGERLFAQHFDAYPNVVAPINKSVPNSNKRTIAFQAYELKNYPLAIQLLSDLPQDESTYLYIGLSKLSMDQAQESVSYFDKIQNKESPFYVPANWYKALALVRLDKHREAKKHLLIVTQHASTTGMINKASELLKDLE